MPRGHCHNCQTKISKRYPLVELLTTFAFLLASLVWPENGQGLMVMILSAWLIAASIIGLDNRRLPDAFIQGALWIGLATAWAQQSPLTPQNIITGVLVGFIIFHSLRWTAEIVLCKEALGMGNVLPFAALGGWVESLPLPNVTLVTSCCGLVHAAIIERGPTTLSFRPCLSLGGITTLYLQALS